MRPIIMLLLLTTVSMEGSHYVGKWADLLLQSSSLDPPPDEVGEGRSDGDITDDVTLCNTNTSRPLSFRQTLPAASWNKKKDMSQSEARTKLLEDH